MTYKGLITSPVGNLLIEASDTGLKKLSIEPEDSCHNSVITTADLSRDHPLRPIVEQINLYFNGQLKEFRIKIDWSEHPDFYCRVWRVLLTIPFGKFRSYQQIANFLQMPKSARAIGLANSKNPIAIIIPCHRVIGSNGSLTGYAYGNEIKRKLLHLENPAHFSKQGHLF